MTYHSQEGRELTINYKGLSDITENFLIFQARYFELRSGTTDALQRVFSLMGADYGLKDVYSEMVSQLDRVESMQERKSNLIIELLLLVLALLDGKDILLNPLGTSQVVKTAILAAVVIVFYLRIRRSGLITRMIKGLWFRVKDWLFSGS